MYTTGPVNYAPPRNNSFIVMVLVIRQCAAGGFNVNHPKHPRTKGIPGNKGNLCTRTICLLCLLPSTCFIYIYDTMYLVLFYCCPSSPSSISTCTLQYSRIRAPSSCQRCGSVTPPPPPPSRPLLLFESCRPLSLGLLVNRDTLLEVATCLVPETIWSRRSFTTHRPPAPRHFFGGP